MHLHLPTKIPVQAKQDATERWESALAAVGSLEAGHEGGSDIL